MKLRVVVADLEAFRTSARLLLHRGVPPSEVELVAPEDRQGVLFESAHPSPAGAAPGAPVLRVPRAFSVHAEKVALHRDPDRWTLLYRVLWRLQRQRDLLLLAADPDVRRLEQMARAVRTDEHRLHAFARFRRLTAHGEERYVAWHRPDHRVLRSAAGFFQRRFGEMRWSILTPDESAHWDGAELVFAAGVPRSAAPSEDELEALWRTYYASTFNPARLNLRAMGRELPVRYRSTLPELGLLPGLVAAAPARTRAMTEEESDALAIAPFLPADPSLDSLRGAIRGCTACPLHARATQAVFGEGPANARAVLVGEQPGDQEDLQGRPFVGPAGQVLNEALAEAGVERSAVYLTNAVKHFKWTPDGLGEKRRIHERPGRGELRACKGWLAAELRALEPRMIVCLGATAAASLLGTGFRLNHSRGRVFQLPEHPAVLATWHPSAVLRAADPRSRARLRSELVADLRVLAAALSAPG